MTAVLPPPAPAPQAPEQPPSRPSPATPRPQRARTVVLIVLGALLLSAFMNPDDVLRRARAQPFGWQRDAAVRLAEANRDVSRALWLDRPRRALDLLLGNGPMAPAPVGPSAPPAPSTEPVPTTGPAAPSNPPSQRQPTSADPLRVYFGGDSVAQAVSESFRRLATDSRVISSSIDFRFSTGLSRPDYFDWPARVRKVLRRVPEPEAIVLMFGANDVQPIMTPSGPAGTGSAAWLAEYRRRVASMMQLLTSSGIPVYWLGQPLMRSDLFTKRINELDDIYASEAARHVGVTFIDTRPALSDSHGRYAAYLPDSSGRPVLIRAPDGVHLTDAGGARVARVLMVALRRRWSLP